MASSPVHFQFRRKNGRNPLVRKNAPGRTERVRDDIYPYSSPSSPLLKTTLPTIRQILTAALLALATIALLAVATPATAQTADPTAAAAPVSPAGGIIEGGVFINLLEEGYTTAMVSYYLNPNTWCEALDINRFCPDYTTLDNLQPNTLGLMYAKDCHSTYCSNVGTVFRRVPRLGAAIATVTYRSSEWNTQAGHRVCAVAVRDFAAVAELDGCKEIKPVAVNTNAEIQRAAFIDWLPGFITNLETYGPELGGEGTLQVDDTEFALTATGLDYMQAAMPDFELRFPVLIGQDVTQLVNVDGVYDNSSGDNPIFNVLLDGNEPLNRSVDDAARGFGFENRGAYAFLISTMIAGLLAFYITKRYNLHLGIMAASLTYIPAIFIEPLILTIFIFLLVFLAIITATRWRNLGV